MANPLFSFFLAGTTISEPILPIGSNFKAAHDGVQFGGHTFEVVNADLYLFTAAGDFT